MVTFVKTGAAAAMILAIAVGPGRADPLSDALAKGGSACFERTYAADHRAAHPRQKTHALRLSLAAKDGIDGAIIRIHFVRQKSELYIVGGCGFADPANRDVQGKPLIAAFTAKSGLDCQAMTSANGSSAEEGGDFPIDFRDGKTIVLYLPEDLAGWPSLDRSKAAGFSAFGVDDRVFRLERVADSRCRAMNAALPGW